MATLSERSFPDAEYVGEHLVIDKAEWVPGKHPYPHRRYKGQTEYLEKYIRCIQCGVEVLNGGDFPDECDGDRQ